MAAGLLKEYEDVRLQTPFSRELDRMAVKYGYQRTGDDQYDYEMFYAMRGVTAEDKARLEDAAKNRATRTHTGLPEWAEFAKKQGYPVPLQKATLKDVAEGRNLTQKRAEIWDALAEGRAREQLDQMVSTLDDLAETPEKRAEYNAFKSKVDNSQGANLGPLLKEGTALYAKWLGVEDSEVPFKIQAYHGTGAAPFEKFSNEAIGSGEGAQAFGHGHYFAGMKEVAESYARALGEPRILIHGQIVPQNAPAAIRRATDMILSKAIHKMATGDSFKDAIEKGLAWAEIRYKGNIENGEAELRYRARFGKPSPSTEYGKVTEAELLTKLAEDKRGLDYIGTLAPSDFTDEPGRTLLSTTLAPDEADLLDWDKPLSEQSETVREALRNLFTVDRSNPFEATAEIEGTNVGATFHHGQNMQGESLSDDAMIAEVLKRYSGAELYHNLRSVPEEASSHLASLGIPGIRYLDGSSRNKGEGSHNYVIFDPENITIDEAIRFKKGKPPGDLFASSPSEPVHPTLATNKEDVAPWGTEPGLFGEVPKKAPTGPEKVQGQKIPERPLFDKGSDLFGEPEERVLPTKQPESQTAKSVPWADSKPGDVVNGYGDILVRRSIYNKKAAKELAGNVGGTVVLDGAKAWGVIRPKEERVEPTRLRLAPKGAQGVPHAQAVSIASRLTKGWEGGPKVEVHRSYHDAPSRYRRALSEASGKVMGFYDIAGDTIHLFSANLRTGQDAVDTVMHEFFGHAGIRRVLTSSQMEGLFTAAQKSMPDDVARLRDLNELDLDTEDGRAVLVDELFADKAETVLKGDEKSGAVRAWVRRVLANIRLALRDLYAKAGRTMGLSDNDILQMLKQGREAMKRGEKPPGKVDTGEGGAYIYEHGGGYGPEERSGEVTGPARIQDGKAGRDKSGRPTLPFAPRLPFDEADRAAASTLNKEVETLYPQDNLKQKAPAGEALLGLFGVEVRNSPTPGERAMARAEGIARRMAKRGALALIGERADTPARLAALAQILRDHRFETARLFWVDAEGTILGHSAVSSRCPSLSAVFPQNWDESAWIARLKGQGKRLGATGYYLLHNHPSGQVKPSAEDLSYTWSWDAKLNGFMGHIIIDHDKYSVIRNDGTVEEGIPLHAPSVPAQRASSQGRSLPDTLKVHISGAAELARLAAQLQKTSQVLVINTTNNLDTVSILTLPEGKAQPAPCGWRP